MGKESNGALNPELIPAYWVDEEEVVRRLPIFRFPNMDKPYFVGVDISVASPSGVFLSHTMTDAIFQISAQFGARVYLQPFAGQGGFDEIVGAGAMQVGSKFAPNGMVVLVSVLNPDGLGSFFDWMQEEGIHMPRRFEDWIEPEMPPDGAVVH